MIFFQFVSEKETQGIKLVYIHQPNWNCSLFPVTNESKSVSFFFMGSLDI